MNPTKMTEMDVKKIFMGWHNNFINECIKTLEDVRDGFDETFDESVQQILLNGIRSYCMQEVVMHLQPKFLTFQKTMSLSDAKGIMSNILMPGMAHLNLSKSSDINELIEYCTAKYPYMKFEYTKLPGSLHDNYIEYDDYIITFDQR